MRIESCQSLLLFSLSNSKDFLTDLDIMIPNLCVCCQYFYLNFFFIKLRFFIVYGTHQANEGWSWILLDNELSETSIR